MDEDLWDKVGGLGGAILNWVWLDRDSGDSEIFLGVM